MIGHQLTYPISSSQWSNFVVYPISTGFHLIEFMQAVFHVQRQYFHITARHRLLTTHAGNPGFFSCQSTLQWLYFACIATRFAIFHAFIKAIHAMLGHKFFNRLMRWKVKMGTNDDMRNQFLDMYVPKIWELGFTIPDPLLKKNPESTGSYFPNLK